MTDVTPAHVAAKATIEDVIDLNALTLIGVMKAHDGQVALLRSSRGQIARVVAGQDIFGIKVTAIGEAHILIADRNGGIQTLQVPRS